MKYTIHLLITLVLTSLLIVGCNTGSSNELTQAQLDSIERAKQDSIRTADSLAKVQQQRREARKQQLAKNFRVKTDDFSEYSWVYHNTTPETDLCNSIHFCILMSKESGKATDLYFCFHLARIDWLFAKSLVFRIDKKNYTVDLDEERDWHKDKIKWPCFYESFRIPASVYDIKYLISKLVRGKTCDIKIIGSEGTDTTTLTKEQLKAIKETIEYYILLGGKLGRI